MNGTCWGSSVHELYTAGSDGLVRCWDVLTDPEAATGVVVFDNKVGVMDMQISPQLDYVILGDDVGDVAIVRLDTSCNLLPWGYKPLTLGLMSKIAKIEEDITSEELRRQNSPIVID